MLIRHVIMCSTSLFFLVAIMTGGVGRGVQGQSMSNDRGFRNVRDNGCLGPTEPNALKSWMTDRGMFLSDFMAINIEDAAKMTDLSNPDIYSKPPSSVCDSGCQRRTAIMRNIFANHSPDSGSSYPPPGTHYPQFTTNKRNKRDVEADWERNDQSLFEEIEIDHNTVSINYHRRDDYNASSREMQPVINIRRSKRSSGPIRSVLNLGDLIPMPYNCWHAGEAKDSVPGLTKLCGACRGVVAMDPNRWFPPFINVISCGKGQCLKSTDGANHGICVEAFNNFEMLFNKKTRNCPDWEPRMVKVPVCCECLLQAGSHYGNKFFRKL